MVKVKETVELAPVPAVSVPCANNTSSEALELLDESVPVKTCTVPVGAVFPLTPATVTVTPTAAVVVGEELVELTVVVEVSRVEAVVTAMVVPPLAEL